MRYVMPFASLRIACDDHHPFEWIRGWEQCLHQHVLRAVRISAPQGPKLKALISGAFGAGAHQLNEGRSGPDVCFRQ